MPESREPEHELVYEPFDPDYLRDLVERRFSAVLDHYFRPRLIGRRRLPDRGPAILAGNHSGTAFPWDAMALDAVLWRADDYEPERLCRPVFEKELSVTWWMRPFGIDDFWRRGGGIDMTFDNFHHVLAGGERVLYYPEGVPGIGKGFARRYQLQRFSSSFVIQAARHDAPVVPIYTINAEWVIPFNFTLRPIDRLLKKVARVPFLPLPAGPLAILFPWLWYLALPARMIYVVGEPIDVRSVLGSGLAEEPASPTLEEARAAAEQVRGRMQSELDRYVERYGRRPYQGRLLRRKLSHATKKRRLHRSLPWGWVWSFVSHDRDRQRPAARNRLFAWLRDWDLLLYYLPGGWLLISMARRWRKPPYGFRGLSQAERRHREGSFHWHLDGPPMPAAEAMRRRSDGE